jgi:hypothetical protein
LKSSPFADFITLVVKSRQSRGQPQDLTSAIARDAIEAYRADNLKSVDTAVMSIAQKYPRANPSLVVDPNMDQVTAQDVLDSVDSIYKVPVEQTRNWLGIFEGVMLMSILQVQLKTFIANVTTQVIERHLVDGLETIFSPVDVVAQMTDERIMEIIGESAAETENRQVLEARVAKLEEGKKELLKVMQ